MSDLRDKQPEQQAIDLTHQTRGNHVWTIRLWSPTYFGIKNEDVYSKYPTFLIRAMEFSDAVSQANVLRAAIEACHDIWQVEILGVERK